MPSPDYKIATAGVHCRLSHCVQGAMENDWGVERGEQGPVRSIRAYGWPMDIYVMAGSDGSEID